MVETCVGPSELHLKKELSALRKARFLRDPETCSSWRSPLSSRSLAASYVLTHGNGTRGSTTGVSNSGGLIGLPSRNDNRKKVYLYNWRHHSAKSSDSGTKLDGDNRGKLLEESPDDSLSNTSKLDSQSDASLQVPANICGITRGPHLEAPVRRTIRKSHRSSTVRKRTIKHPLITKHLDLPSDSIGIPKPVEQSDDTEYCNSEDLRQSMHEFTRRAGYVSHSGSPLFSGSGRRNWSRSKIFRNATREESSHSYTPASTCSYNRYGVRNPSTVGSWDGTTSFDEDELDHMELARRQGCGIPCYWPKRSKDVGCGGWYSPSLSDTLKRTGSSVLCGGQKLYNKKRFSSSRKQKYLLKSSQGLPLLTNGRGGGSSSSDAGSDELSTNLVELDLEALSRLDGKRWSSCKSQDGWESALPGRPDLEMHDHRGLSHKYRPRSFDDVVGQNIVVQSLSNAVLRGRVAAAYLFHGPRGTGKTSAARIFSAALNCMSTEDKKPCGFCKECSDFSSGNGSNVIEVDATNRKSMDSVRYMLKSISVVTKFSRYKIFIIDECHMISSKLWSLFMKFLEAPPPRVVFIYITIDPDNLPRSILSRCQKYLFPKIKDADIVCRLRKLSAEENLEVELDALDLIASNSDGSLRDAETILDQLSLLGKKITTALVNDLVGVVSEEKLLDLLEIAMSSDTAETVKRSRELMDSGVDPMALMSQLAALIMDIIAGTYQLANSQNRTTVLGGRSLTESELERLQQALKILSDAEKQLRVSSERSTWFTAALLQLGSGHTAETTQSSNSSKHSTKLVNKDPFDPVKEISLEECSSHHQSISHEQKSALIPRITSPHGCPISENFSANKQFVDMSLLDSNSSKELRYATPEEMAEIWRRCIGRCHSKTLRQLLFAHGTLVSITESKGALIAFIGFLDDDVKSRAERFLSSITNSFEIVLRHNVEVKMGLMPEHYKGKSVSAYLANKSIENARLLVKKKMDNSDELYDSSEKDIEDGTPNFSRKSIDSTGDMIQRTLQKHHEKSLGANTCFRGAAGHILSSEKYGNDQELSVQRLLTAAADEQRLESAWLQATEKGAPGDFSHSKPEKNQVLPQNTASYNYNGSSLAPMSSKHWEDELNEQIKALKICDSRVHYNEKVSGRVDCSVISPSLLHSNSLAANFDKENLGYDSGSGCNALFCWNTRKPRNAKVKQRAHVRSQRTSRLSLFGQCGKSKTPESKHQEANPGDKMS
ncbi:hypothetical protein J5N97_012672 [Dioscorea zingiberensis]|uniref:Uncharacterized protein n=1 Tax=Dioscorea zingiberensis TaxID=325984 RepID=A0A9D5CS53_9LILI|nr:hypothetical protein J5N97_012672 [Dioscorea zingiberensis]